MSREKLIGTWRAQRWEWRDPAGSQLLFATENLNGLLIYSADGMMSAQVTSTPGAARLSAPRVDLQWLRLWLKSSLVTTPGFQFSYAGRFEIDEAQARVFHHIEVRSWLAPTDAVVEREYAFRDGRLWLEFSSRTARERLIWMRD